MKGPRGNVLPSGVAESQIADYRRAASLLWNAAGFRASRTTRDEREAMYAAARILTELADADEGRPGATR